MSRNAFFLFFFLFVVFFLGFSGCTSQGGNGASDDSGKVDASCILAADCEANDLGHERCLGNWNCIDRTCQWQCRQDGEKKVTLYAVPISGEAPLTVFFSGVVHLVNEEDKEKFYCPSITWDFGDGQGYAAMPSCIPYQPGISVVPIGYEHEHVYKVPGTYAASLTLNEVITHTITITVPSINPDFICETNEDCRPQGCAGQICARSDANIFTTCEAKSWYSCLPLNHCGCVEGVCQYDDNDEFKGCFEEKSLPIGGPTPVEPVETILWSEAVELLNAGRVESIGQGHNLIVGLDLKDGRRVRTAEPQIDDIFKAVGDCGEVCKDISMATE